MMVKEMMMHNERERESERSCGRLAMKPDVKLSGFCVCIHTHTCAGCP